MRCLAFSEGWEIQPLLQFYKQCRIPAELANRTSSHGPCGGTRQMEYAPRIPRPNPLPREFAASMQLLLETWQPENGADVDCGAQTFGMSRRTLQRLLAETGTKFSNLQARARLVLATRMLRKETMKVIDIAYELGYSAPAHFTHAFRRWAGVSPRAYRIQQTALANAA